MKDNSYNVSKPILEAGKTIREKWGKRPQLVVVTGSGLDYIAELVDVEIRLSYDDIPGFKPTRIPGHAGFLLLGSRNGMNLAVLNGRAHYYEGYSMQEITRPVQTLAWLGARSLLVTSAVGSVVPDFQPGMLALVRDHINLVQDNPLIGPNEEGLGPRYPDLLRAYTPDLRSRLQRRLGSEEVSTIPEAVLAFLSGPCFETETELKWLESIGAQLVGWSLVPEVIAASHAGLSVMALVLVTDFSHPEHVEKVDVAEIFDVGPSHKSEHLPIFENAIAVIEESLALP